MQVCFSDESVFQVMCDKGQYVRRRVNEEFHPACVVSTVKHPTSVMVWSVISGKGLGRLQIVQGTMRQDQYKTILENRLIPQIRDWFPDGESFHFMQDGAPCHTAKGVKTFLQSKNIPLLDWPGNSPDMNPIQSMWEIVKRKMKSETITTKTKLIETLIRVWNHDDEVQTNCRTCIESMPRRIAALIKAKGGPTKY